MPLPSFLDVPSRHPKPRPAGLTHVIDPGVGLATTVDTLDSAADYADIWKFGWGTAYIDPALDAKLALLRDHRVASCLGGTLLEIAWAQGVAEECLAWAADRGFDHVEVSRGTVAMPLNDKRELIQRASRRFSVLAEVGTKAPGEQNAVKTWPVECRSDLDAGAQLIVTEGRQSGTVGTYDTAGRIRAEVVDAVLGEVGVDRLIFEAPRQSQHAWFIRHFGPDVNLGNIALADLFSLETLRLGLRSDTVAVDQQGRYRMTSA